MAEALEDFVTFLREMFPSKPIQQIQEIVDLVKTEAPGNSFEYQMETMVNLLSGNSDPKVQEDEHEEGDIVDKIGVKTDKIYSKLLEFFPNASREYLWSFCNERGGNLTVAEAIDILIRDGYDKIDPIFLWEQLKEALPNADPSYLRKKAERLCTGNLEEIEQFLINAIENNDYPTRYEYMKTKHQEDKLRIYKQMFFNVETYLKVIPNPEETFCKKDRLPTLNLETADPLDIECAQDFLYSQYRFVRKQHINRVFQNSNGNLTQASEILNRMRRGLKKERDAIDYNFETRNEQLLQEMAYLRNRRLINRYIKNKDETYKLMKQEAMKYDLLETCACCYDDELIPEECFFCMRGCTFCKSCVLRGVETQIGEGSVKFPCFANCNSEFSLRTLQLVLPETAFKNVVRRLQSEEIKKAKIEGLETCPFCDFAKPLPPEEKIFKCENSDCAKESCRECRHESHIPKRCNEIEYDEDVQRRIYIENKMTEALTRTCQNCNKTFIKTNGCNKMTCSCGAKMCYICNIAINDYSHFGDNKCPLFTNDNEINLKRVLTNVAQAKAELGNVEVKFDPSVGIEQFYK